MFMRVDRLQAELPKPKDANPNAAAALQELIGGQNCGKFRDLNGVASAFAPDYAPEEMFEIATKLTKKSR